LACVYGDMLPTALAIDLTLIAGMCRVDVMFRTDWNCCRTWTERGRRTQHENSCSRSTGPVKSTC
jgi:hypothetical protein